MLASNLGWGWFLSWPFINLVSTKRAIERQVCQKRHEVQVTATPSENKEGWEGTLHAVESKLLEFNNSNVQCRRVLVKVDGGGVGIILVCDVAGCQHLAGLSVFLPEHAATGRMCVEEGRRGEAQAMMQ